MEIFFTIIRKVIILMDMTYRLLPLSEYIMKNKVKNYATFEYTYLNITQNR